MEVTTRGSRARASLSLSIENHICDWINRACNPEHTGAKKGREREGQNRIDTVQETVKILLLLFRRSMQCITLHTVPLSSSCCLYDPRFPSFLPYSAPAFLCPPLKFIHSEFKPHHSANAWMCISAHLFRVTFATTTDPTPCCDVMSLSLLLLFPSFMALSLDPPPLVLIERARAEKDRRTQWMASHTHLVRQR